MSEDSEDSVIPKVEAREVYDFVGRSDAAIFVALTLACRALEVHSAAESLPLRLWLDIVG